MANGPVAMAYKIAFLERTRAAMEARSYTQEGMAELLLGSRKKQAIFNKYVTRTPLPHYLIPKFCLICQIPVDWLMDIDGTSLATNVPAPPAPKKSGRARRVAKKHIAA